MRQPKNNNDGLRAYNSHHVESNDEMAVPPSQTALEDSLSQTLLKLSLTDRNAVEEEIHGVRCLTKETPDLLGRSLKEFNRELLATKNSPSRIASLRYSKSKSNGNAPRADVLRNVVDTTTNTPPTTTTSTTIPSQNCYLNDPDVRLRFLRCENFDTKAAAKRFVNFLELATEVFGESVADRPIRLKDFLETTTTTGGRGRRHEKKAFSNSEVQYMPFRDRSGRRVKVGVGGGNSELDLFLRIKINLLLDWIASEDVETQQKGVVVVVWPFNPPTTNTNTNTNTNNTPGYISSSNNTASGASSSGVSSCSETDEEDKWEGFLRPRYTQNVVAYHNRYYHAQPIRVAAMHWCSQDKPIYRILNSLYYFSLDSKTQSRYKVHFGEPLEIRYRLQGFGIPVDLMPLTHTMALKRQNHLQWTACRRHIEEQQQQQQQEQQRQKYQQHQEQQQARFPNTFLRQPLKDERTVQFFEAFSTASSGSTPGPSISSAAQGRGQQQPVVVVVECPRSYDIIIGKAKVCTNNPGNVFYSSLIEATHDEHESLVQPKQKVAVTWKILFYITDRYHGRFLDWNKALNAWVVIQDKVVIRKKIANSFKEYKRSRYVTAARSPNGSNKKKHAPSATSSSVNNGSDNNSSGNNSSDNNSSSDDKPPTSSDNANGTNFKRRKLGDRSGSVCCDGDAAKGIESMFAAL